MPKMMSSSVRQIAPGSIISRSKKSGQFPSAAGLFPSFADPSNAHRITAAPSLAAVTRIHERDKRAKIFRD